jgi:hypothetical protein
MRWALAAVIDAIAAGLLGYLGFWFGDWVTPCPGGQGNCAPLAPIIVLCVILPLAVYFGFGFLLWRGTPGRRALQVEPDGQVQDDLN